MNNRAPLLLIFGLISLALAFLVAQQLKTEKKQINPAIDKGLINPYGAGFNKFLADLAWMQSLQHRGSIDKLNDDLVDILYRRADRLTSFDPYFYEAYGQAALEIGYLKGDLAIKLLDKAMATGSCNDFNIPFRAGWIAAYWKDDPAKAVVYYEKARSMPASPPHLDRLILYQKGKLARDNPEVVLQLWVNYLTGSAGGSAPSGSGHATKLDPQDMQLALKKVNELAEKIIADAKAKGGKPGEIEKKIAYVQQMVSDAANAADRSSPQTGALNNIVKVGTERVTALEPRANRKGFSVQNIGRKPVLLKLGFGASKTSYGFVLQPNGGSYSAQGYLETVTAICPDGESEIAVIEIY